MSDDILKEILIEVKRGVRELVQIRQLVSRGVNDMEAAEKEIPEWMRRFANYMHDCHDIKYMYEEHGQDVPPHILRELERLDDRYRQLLMTANTDGGAFEKIRREMAADPENRWDHTRLLTKPKEASDEARKSE